MVNKQEITTKEQVLKQPLLNNQNLLFNRKPLNFRHWNRSGFKNIYDIWNIDTNTWVEDLFIFHKLCKKSNWIRKYTKIRKAIPSAWKKILTLYPSKRPKPVWYHPPSKRPKPAAEFHVYCCQMLRHSSDSFGVKKQCNRDKK